MNVTHRQRHEVERIPNGILHLFFYPMTKKIDLPSSGIVSWRAFCVSVGNCATFRPKSAHINFMYNVKNYQK